MLFSPWYCLWFALSSVYKYYLDTRYTEHLVTPYRYQILLSVIARFRLTSEITYFIK